MVSLYIARIIVYIVPWCPAVYKTSTTTIQSVGFTVTGIPFCFSELLMLKWLPDEGKDIFSWYDE